MALDSDKYKKNMEDGAKATQKAANAADGLKQNLRDALFFTRDFADQAKDAYKALGEGAIQASEGAKAFRDVAKAAKEITDNYADVLTGEKKYADLIKERQKLRGAENSFLTEFEQQLQTLRLTESEISGVLSGQVDLFKDLGDKAGNLNPAQKDLLDLFVGQNRELLEEKGNLEEIERRAKNIDEAMSFGKDGAVGIGDMADGADKLMDKLGMGGIKDKLKMGDAVKDARKYAAELTNGGTNIDKMGKAIPKSGQAMKVMSKMAGTMGKNLTKALGPIGILLFVAQKLQDAFKLIDGASGDIAKTQGISAEEAAKQVGYANQQALMSGKISLSTKDVLAAQTSLNKLTGTSVQFSGEMATQFAHIQDRLKLSAESMAVFASNALRGKGDINSQMQDISNITMELNQQSGVTMNMKDIQEGIGKLSASQRLSAKGNTKELANQVYQSKLLGLSASQLEGVQNSLLDFESSIAAEMEAELMTGKQLNLEGARAAALAGDQAALAVELRKEVGSIAEFESMNVMQRQSLAKAFGLNVDQMAEMLNKQENLEQLKKAGFASQSAAQEKFNSLVEDGMSAEEASAEMKRLGIDDALAAQMKNQTVSDKMAAAQERLTDLFVAIVEPLMPLIQAIMDLLGPISAILSPIFALVGEIVGLIMDVLQPIITNFVKNIEDVVKNITDIFGGIKDIFVGIFTLDGDMILGGLKKIGSGIIGLIIDPFINAYETVMSTFSGLGDWFSGLFEFDVDPILKKIGDSLYSLIIQPFVDQFMFIKKMFTDVFDYLGSMGSKFVNSFSDKFVQGFKNMANMATQIILAPIQFLMELAIGALNSLIYAANKIPFVNISEVEVPDLAGAVALEEGGIAPATPGGISAIVGEGGEAEAIIPLSKAGEMGFGGSDMTETNKLLKQLISAVNSGGDVFLDGNKVGKSLAIATSNMG